jgi:hypothetical protein
MIFVMQVLNMKNKEKHECAICGEEYEGYGNSTWGWWEFNGISEADNKGEHKRCCDACNIKCVVPARLYLSKVNHA